MFLRKSTGAPFPRPSTYPFRTPDNWVSRTFIGSQEDSNGLMCAWCRRNLKVIFGSPCCAVKKLHESEVQHLVVCQCWVVP